MQLLTNEVNNPSSVGMGKFVNKRPAYYFFKPGLFKPVLGYQTSKNYKGPNRLKKESESVHNGTFRAISN
jgi:hypothetical protein